ncbi:MAG: 7-carboxy-7-deazaguanine synthase QueE [bacterium]
MESPPRGTGLGLRIPLADPLFHSLQGEGATLGRPSVFVRLMGCTVGCSWCDTKYSWEGPPVEERTLAEILAYCRERPGSQVIVTGGEPLESEHLSPLVGALKKEGLRVEIETSGYIPPSDALLWTVDQWNVSPKLASAGIAPEKQPRSLDWLRRAKEPYLKFVLHKPEEMDEVEEILKKYALGDFPRERVIISPGGKKRKDMEKRLLPLAEAALKRGFRFTPRLHVILWSDKRGV